MPDITVELCKSVLDVQRHQARWNQLAGQRSLLRWEWLGTWYHHCARNHDMMVLIVRKDDQIIGFTPWYVRNSHLLGQAICFLGDRRTSTDHLSLLCDPEYQDLVVDSVADWLVDSANQPKSAWSHLELTGVDADDPVISRLVEQLAERRFSVDRRNGTGCYEIELPATYEEYLQRRSRPGRRECRQLAKRLDEGEVEVLRVESQQQLGELWFDFVDLHNLRRDVVGDEGCFREDGFGEFLWDAASKLLAVDLLRLYFLMADGIPVAAHFAIVNQDRWMYYQTGMHMAYSELKPGKLLLAHAVREAIRENIRYFDMMRGQEHYKQSWRAVERPQLELRIAKPNTSAIVRQKIWQFGKSIQNLTRHESTLPA